MQLIVISSTNKFDSELNIIPRLFDSGLQTFHLRKPKFSYHRLDRYLNKFPPEHLQKIVIHSHHRLALKYKLKGIHITEKQKKNEVVTWIKYKTFRFLQPHITISTSFHSLTDLLSDNNSYEYVFLSPVFNSISKKDYPAAFNESKLKQALTETSHRVIALGGVQADNITRAIEYGFSGVAVLGAIWKEQNDHVKAFKELCHALPGKVRHEVRV